MQAHLNLQTPYFPLLPIPLLLSPLPSSSDEIFLRCCSSAAAADSIPGYDLGIGVPRQLDPFPVSDALCNFLSAVLPQHIELRNGGSPVDVLDLDAGSANDGVQVSEEKVDNTTGAKNINWIDIVQFEVPELSQFSQGAWELERKRAEILSNVPKFDENLEMTRLPASDLHLHEVQRSVYSIENVPPTSILNVNISDDNDISLRKNHLNDSVFPQLELEEITRGTFGVISMEDELQSAIANMEALNDRGKYDDEVNWKELFSSMEIEQISDQISSKLFLEPLVADSNFFLEIGHDCNTEPSCTEEETGFHFGDSDFLVELVPFEEFKMLDPEYLEISDAFTIPQISLAPEKCDKLTLEGLNFKSFDELIVCHEISMVDQNFKSFPVPILPDDEKIQSLYAIITELLEGLELLPVSASDEIYLDWDLLGKDKGNCDIHATFQRMFSDIGILKLGYDIQSTEDSGLLLDFIFADDIWDEMTTENKMSIPSGGNAAVYKPLSADLTDKMLDDGHKRAEGGQKKISADLVSSRAESAPQFNELDYFLNPRKAITGMQSDVRPLKLDIQPGIPAPTCQDREKSSSCTRIQMDKWDIKLHLVHLPASMLSLIQNFEKSFLAVTEDLHLNSKLFSFPNADGMLSLPEEKLMDCMKILLKDKTFSGHVNAVTSAFCALLAIKRMTWCLCSFGIHCLHEFIDKVLQEVECLRSRLGLLIPYIEETYTSANKEIIKLHPSLDLIQGILKARTSQRSKILIVAEQKLWWPLKSLLVSMNVAVSDVTSLMHGSLPDASDFHKSSQSRRNIIQSDCLLVTHMHMSAAILSKQFDIILEYGGLHSSSQLTSILPKPTYSLNLHFLKVELDGSAKALCTGVDIPSSSMLEELLNFVPMVENCKLLSMDVIGQKMHGCMPLPNNCMPIDSKSNSADLSSCPHTTIIVNTQDFDAEMIISRRSTYQRVLAMEKEGVQILERDFCLPVDVIISAGMCLAWYNCKNIGKKATAPDEAASSVPLCVDNLAANVLTSLSFTFGSCIMVFEGESNFIATITESSDELYAAAASLGIELQIFCSYSPELTEEIVLNCITYGMKFHKGLFPKLSESETIAESFLMKFPSINPLSALAILSTGAMLVDFFGWSENCRIRALHKYHVPDESVILLSILSRYGKREESISGMTDCSSSVSSAPNSERLECKFSFEKRKREFNESCFDAVNVDNLYKPTTSRLLKTSAEPPLNVEAFYEEVRSGGADKRKRKFNGSSFDAVKVDNLYKPTTSRLLKTSAEAPLDVEAFYEELRLDDAEKINPNMVSEPQINWRSENSNLMEDIPEVTLPSNSRSLGLKTKSAMRSSIRLPGDDADIFKGLSDDFMGEVVDINDDPLFGGNFSSGKKAAKFILPEHEAEEAPGIKSSRAIRRLSFDHATHPNFSSLSSQQTAFNIFELNQRKEEPLVGEKADKPGTYLHKLLNKEKVPYGYEGTPLRKSIYSNELEGASPWTKEFLNQVREKMRLHRQYLKSDTSTPRADFCATASKNTKRRSPSIVELFKYQGGKTPTKSARKVRQKEFTQPPTLSKNENDSSMFPHTWTPIDKRAMRTLSFATCGRGGQTKLVWSDGSSPSPAKRFRQ